MARMEGLSILAAGWFSLHSCEQVVAVGRPIGIQCLQHPQHTEVPILECHANNCTNHAFLGVELRLCCPKFLIRKMDFILLPWYLFHNVTWSCLNMIEGSCDVIIFLAPFVQAEVNADIISLTFGAALLSYNPACLIWILWCLTLLPSVLLHGIQLQGIKVNDDLQTFVAPLMFDSWMAQLTVIMWSTNSILLLRLPSSLKKKTIAMIWCEEKLRSPRKQCMTFSWILSFSCENELIP
jgi:hypothetical protein